MTKELNLAQLNRLRPYVSYFRIAIRSGYCSYPGPKAVDTMREIWLELTGNNYPMNPSCSTCIFNLIRDMGTLYRAQRPIGWKEKKEAEKAAKEAAKAAGQGKAQTENESPAEGAEPGKEEE